MNFIRGIPSSSVGMPACTSANTNQLPAPQRKRRSSAFRAPSGLFRLVELVGNGIRQGFQAGLNDVVGNANRGPGGYAVRRFNEDADIGTGAVFLRSVRNVCPRGGKDAHLVINQVHLLQFRIPAREGAPQGAVQRMHGTEAARGGMFYVAVHVYFKGGFHHHVRVHFMAGGENDGAQDVEVGFQRLVRHMAQEKQFRTGRGGHVVVPQGGVFLHGGGKDIQHRVPLFQLKAQRAGKGKNVAFAPLFRHQHALRVPYQGRHVYVSRKELRKLFLNNTRHLYYSCHKVHS